MNMKTTLISRVISSFALATLLFFGFGIAPIGLKAQSLGDALNTNLLWTTGGAFWTNYPIPGGFGTQSLDPSWTTQTNVTHDGLAARSAGPLTASGQDSWIETTVTNTGYLFFWWKANLNGYQDYGTFGGPVHRGGKMELYLNGSVDRSSFYGTDWSRQFLYCNAGTNTVRWRVLDENDYSSGQDQAWLDEVVFLPDPMAPQVWTQPPPTQKFAEGATVNFSVTALGTPPLYYQWKQDGNNVSGATNSTLTLTNVALSQAGAYTVTITNTSGTATSSNANLQVVSALPLNRMGQWPGYERSPTECVAVNGNRAYVGNVYWNTYGAFLVLDVSDPSHPVLLGKLEGVQADFNHLRAVGNYVVAALGDGLSVINVNDPAQPQVVTNLNLGNISDLQIVGNYAYAISYNSGLVILDISDPTHPAVLASNNSLVCFAQGVSVAGNYAYVVGRCGGTLAVVDVSSPTNLVVVGSLGLGSPADRIAVKNNTAFISTWSGGTEVVDVSTPTNPVIVTNIASGFAMGFAGDELYLGSGFNLLSFNISTPTHPVQVASYNLFDYLENFQVVSNRVYIANWERGLTVVDISDPNQPTKTSDYPSSAESLDLEIAGNFAFMVEGKGGLQILNVSNPSQPTPLGRYSPPNGECQAVKLVGNLAFVACGDAGLHILDVSDPSHPLLKGSCPNAPAKGVDVAGDYAYVGGGFSGFQIVDVSNPEAPAKISQTNITQLVSALKIDGHYLYSRTWYDDTLIVVDISNPLQPVKISEIPFGSQTGNFFIQGNRLYSDRNIVDISDPFHPVVMRQYNDRPGHVDCVGDLAFVADGYGLSVWDFGTPPSVLLGHADTTGWSQGVKVAGQYAFLADDDWGLQVFQLPTNFINAPSLGPWPASRSISAGSNLTLPANASGQPPVAYQWFFDGQPVSGETNWVLSLNNLQPTNSGIYSVIVSNPAGMATNQTGLDVFVRPDILTGGTNAIHFDGAGRFSFGFLAQSGANYVIEYANTLGSSNWTVLTNIAGTAPSVTIVDPASPVDWTRFYRIRKE
jgi:hypothetical protein